LKLIFWPILYDSIVFVCLQTQEVSIQLKIILLKFYFSRKISKPLFYRTGFCICITMIIVVIFEKLPVYFTRYSVATQLRSSCIFTSSSNFIENVPQFMPVKSFKSWSIFRDHTMYGQKFAAYFWGHPVYCTSFCAFPSLPCSSKNAVAVWWPCFAA